MSTLLNLNYKRLNEYKKRRQYQIYCGEYIIIFPEGIPNFNSIKNNIKYDEKMKRIEKTNIIIKMSYYYFENNTVYSPVFEQNCNIINIRYETVRWSLFTYDLTFNSYEYEQSKRRIIGSDQIYFELNDYGRKLIIYNALKVVNYMKEVAGNLSQRIEFAITYVELTPEIDVCMNIVKIGDKIWTPKFYSSNNEFCLVYDELSVV